MGDSPCFTIFSSIVLVKTPGRHKITIRNLAWRCLCRFCGTISLPIAEESVKTWKSFNVQFGTCGNIFISVLRDCARNSNFDAKELKLYTNLWFVFQSVHWPIRQDHGTSLEGAQEAINIREHNPVSGSRACR